MASLLFVLQLGGGHSWWYRLLGGLGVVLFLALLVADLRDYRAARRFSHQEWDTARPTVGRERQP